MKYPIMNEPAVIDAVLQERGDVSTHVALSLLARYYIHTKEYKTREATEELHTYLLCHIPDYRREQWDSAVTKAIKIGRARKPMKYPAVKITAAEMALVDSQETLAARRLLFTLIVLAKHHNDRRGDNTNWVNYPISELLRYACNSGDSKKGLECIHRFYQKGYVVLRSGIGKLSLQVLCLDEGGDSVLELDDLRVIGYEYMNYKQTGKFSRCADCGLLFKQNQQCNRKYCENCRQRKPNPVRAFVCVDCGTVVAGTHLAFNKTRCNECQKQHRLEYERKRMAIKRQNLK